MQGLTVCVNYSHLLKITARYLLRHLDRLLIITSHDDPDTIDLARSLGSRVKILQTDAFYLRGAHFNKGLAIEKGFDALGREGWIMVVDSDIVLPWDTCFESFKVGNLYSPWRRLVSVDQYSKPGAWTWKELHVFPDQELAGYCQIFNADDPVLQKRPWYGTDWKHAGGCDSVFEQLWAHENKVRPSWSVLHLGEASTIGRNWCGVSDEKRLLTSQLMDRRRRTNTRDGERLDCKGGDA